MQLRIKVHLVYVLKNDGGGRPHCPWGRWTLWNWGSGFQPWGATTKSAMHAHLMGIFTTLRR
jgi:hypothetical protein